MELPKSDVEVKHKKSDFSAKQKIRRETIRDKMEKRKEESRIRIEAQKAAREEERKRHGVLKSFRTTGITFKKPMTITLSKDMKSKRNEKRFGGRKKKKKSKRKSSECENSWTDSA